VVRQGVQQPCGRMTRSMKRRRNDRVSQVTQVLSQPSLDSFTPTIVATILKRS
jgi:hypothetical protein